jgi:hypothetical protein
MICALLLVLWIVVIVILPAVDLPHTTLPARYAALSGLLMFGAAAFGVLPCYSSAHGWMRWGQQDLRPGASVDLVNLTCCRLC